jgi:O-antigen/teichoic acid export membrane protein
MITLRRSLAFAFLDKYAGTVLTLLTTAVVARLLTPAEVGVFMVGNALVMLTASFRDFGAVAYLIQKHEITPKDVRLAFTTALILSWAISFALFMVAPFISDFYGEQGLEIVLRFAAVGYLITPFSVPILAMLRRDMAFDKLALINFSATSISSLSVIVLAALGFSYLSLAWGALIMSVATMAMAIWHRPRFDSFRLTFGGLRKVMVFGSFATATAMLNMVYEQMPQMILGRALGFGAVGLYSRALVLCRIPHTLVTSAVAPVVLPVLSAQARTGGDLKAPYLTALSYNSAVSWPFLVGLACLADPAVRVLLGEQWLAAVPLVRLVAVASLFLFPAFMTYPMLVSVGRVQDTLTSSLISLPPSLAVVAAASFLSVEAMAASMLITAPFQVYVALYFIRRHVPFTWRDLIEATWKSGVITLCAAIAPALAWALMAAYSQFAFPITVAAILGAAGGWTGGLLLTRHPILMEVEGVKGYVLAAITACNVRRMRGTASS